MDKTTWSHNDNTSAATLLSAELGYGRRGVCYPFYSTYPASVIGGEPIDIIDIKSVGVSGQTPGWQQLLAEGELLPVTEYSVSRQFAVQQPAIHSENCYNLGGSGRYTQSGTAFAYTQLTVTSNPNCTVPNLDALLQAAHAEAQSLGWDVLVDLAESPETYQLFAKYVKLFRDRRAFIQKLTRKGLRDPKTGRYTRINNLSKSARARIAEREFLNHWMESRYAWRPLVFSSEAIIEAINTWREPVAELVKVRKSQTETASSPATFSGLYRTITENVPWPTETTETHTVTMRGRAFFLGKILREQAKAAILNLNPVSTVVELTPYSFVLGWFLNINELARAHWPSVRYDQFVAGTSLHKEETVEHSFAHPGATNLPGYHSGGLILREESYQRAPRGDVPWDLSYRAKLSPAKLLDLYAIMKNFAKGGMHKDPTLRI